MAADVATTKVCSGSDGCGLTLPREASTGAVRGLLCRHCNVMLGNAKDDPSVLRAGASYLERGL